MLDALRRVSGGDQVLSFVRMLYRRASTFMWEDAWGVVHHIHQGEGGEQGDAHAPLVRPSSALCFAGHSGGI